MSLTYSTSRKDGITMRMSATPQRGQARRSAGFHWSTACRPSTPQTAVPRSLSGWRSRRSLRPLRVGDLANEIDPTRIIGYRNGLCRPHDIDGQAAQIKRMERIRIRRRCPSVVPYRSSATRWIAIVPHERHTRSLRQLRHHSRSERARWSHVPCLRGVPVLVD